MKKTTSDAIKAFLMTVEERAKAFGFTAVPLTASEWCRAADIGALEYLSPVSGGGVTSEYRPYVGGRPVVLVEVDRGALDAVASAA